MTVLLKNTRKDLNNEYYKKLYELAKNLLNGIRIERSRHLKRLQKFEELGFWCIDKHLLGAMLQFAEVGGKDIYMKEDDKIIESDFRTSAFCRDAFILINKFANIKKRLEKNVKVKRTT